MRFDPPLTRSLVRVALGHAPPFTGRVCVSPARGWRLALAARGLTAAAVPGTLDAPGWAPSGGVSEITLLSLPFHEPPSGGDGLGPYRDLSLRDDSSGAFVPNENPTRMASFWPRELGGPAVRWASGAVRSSGVPGPRAPATSPWDGLGAANSAQGRRLPGSHTGKIGPPSLISE